MENHLEKGKISSLENPLDRNGDHSAAKVDPLSNTGIVSRPITIPWYLRGKMGDLKVGDEIIFVVFEDTTGMILARCDGEWPGIVPGDVEITENVKLQDMESQVVKSYNNHTHGGIEAGSGNTKIPQ